MRLTTVYFIVNENPKTRNPSTNKVFEGKYVHSSGFQTLRYNDATMYWSETGARKAITRLNKNGPTCPGWAEHPSYKNSLSYKGKYKIVSATLVMDGEE